MKPFKLIPLAALLALPAFAQDHALSVLVPHVYTQKYHMGGMTIETGNPTNLGLRYAHTFATVSKAGDARIAFEASVVKPCSKPEVSIPGPGRIGTYTHEYMALGFSSTWTKVLDFGIAAELRHESSKVEIDSLGPTGANFTTTRYRPWATARVGYTLPVGKAFKPFVTAEYSLPLTNSGTTHPTDPYTFYGNLRGPKSAFTVSGGLRF